MSVARTAGLGERFVHDARLRRPDFRRVVLDPSGLRKDLPELALRGCRDRAGAIEQERAGARRALVEGQDVGHADPRDRSRREGASGCGTPAAQRKMRCCRRHCSERGNRPRTPCSPVLASAHSVSRPMPLPPSPVSRQRLHQRSITYEGFRRDDGLFDIEAHLVDAKDHDFELLTGVRPAGEAVHDMWVRVTIDRAFVDPRDRGPHRQHAVSGRLRPHRAVVREARRRQPRAGLSQAPARRHGRHARLHARHRAAGSLPTAAVQTFAGLRREDEGDRKPFQLDRCHALETTTDNVRRYYPKWYRGARSPATQEPA